MDLLLDLSSESSDVFLLCLCLLSLLFCDSLWIDLCWSLSQDSSMSLILQHIVKWFLFPHLQHFFAPCWAFFLVGTTVHICHMAYLGCLWACSHYRYLFCNWNESHQCLLLWQLCHLTCVGWSLSWSFCAPWHAGGGLHMWHPLSSFLIWPTSWLQNFWLHETATLFYIPSSHLWRGTGTIWLCLLCVSLVGRLSLALPVGCHCTSHQCGSSRRSTLL